MKAAGWYALACAGIIGAAGAVFLIVVRTGVERESVAISMALAFVVQVVGFAIARLYRHRNVMAGWGLGAIICFSALVAYGFVLKAVGMPLDAGLLSLATFLFLTELVEPLLLAK